MQKPATRVTGFCFCCARKIRGTSHERFSRLWIKPIGIHDVTAHGARMPLVEVAYECAEISLSEESRRSRNQHPDRRRDADEDAVDENIRLVPALRNFASGKCRTDICRCRCCHRHGCARAIIVSLQRQRKSPAVPAPDRDFARYSDNGHGHFPDTIRRCNARSSPLWPRRLW